MNIIENFLPLITAIIFGALIISIVKALMGGKVKDIIIILIIGCLLMYILKRPEILEEFGKYAFDYVEKLGVDINEAKQ